LLYAKFDPLLTKLSRVQQFSFFPVIIKIDDAGRGKIGFQAA
jgi:hypothetical protein